jgi:hypothetical protein
MQTVIRHFGIEWSEERFMSVCSKCNTRGFDGPWTAAEVHTLTLTLTHTHTHTHTRARTHTHTHINTQTHAHAQTSTQTLKQTTSQ